MTSAPYRSPVQDAPPYNASLYDDGDCAYITRLVRSMNAASATAEGGSRPGVPWADGAADLAACPRTGGGWPGYLVALRVAAVRLCVAALDRVLAVLAPAYQQQRRAAALLAQDGLTQLSSEQLLVLMQTALATGEKERSGQIARELSRRRVILQLRKVDVMEWVECVDVAASAGAEDLLGAREGHCAAALTPSTADTPWVVVVGGYCEGALSEQAVATPTTYLPRLRWATLTATPQELGAALECDGASLTSVSTSTALLFGGLDAAFVRRNTTYAVQLLASLPRAMPGGSAHAPVTGDTSQEAPVLHLCELRVTGEPPAPRSRHGAGADAGRLYIFGGETDAAAQTDDLFVLDTASGVWRRVARAVAAASWPAPRFNSLSLPFLDAGARFVMYGGAHYADGGDLASLDDVWAFDVATEAWSRLPSCFPRSNGHVGGLCANVALFVGGKDVAEGCDEVRAVRHAGERDGANGGWCLRLVSATARGAAPHWRYTPALVTLPSALALLAGQCRHPSPVAAFLLVPPSCARAASLAPRARGADAGGG